MILSIQYYIYTHSTAGRERATSKYIVASIRDSNKIWHFYLELVGTLEELTKMDRKKIPIENKSLYLRALECKEALRKTVHEVIDKNDKLIRDIELGKN